MITLTLPNSPCQRLELYPEVRSTLGGTIKGPELPSGLISFQGPISIPLTKTRVTDDTELHQFIAAQEKQFSFHLVHMACTFRPLESEPFVNAWLRVDLTRSDGIVEQEHQPIAISMSPRQLIKSREIVQTNEIKLSFKVPSIFNLDLGYGKNESSDEEDVFLEGLFELSSYPSWEFRRTQEIAINGMYRFAIVVRMQKGTITRGMITMGAQVERKHFKLFAYDAAFSGAPSCTFQIPQIP